MNVDDGWEVPRKHRNRSGSNAGKPSVPQNPNPKARGHPDSVQKPGFRNNGGSGKGSATALVAPAADSRRPAGRGNARHQLSNRGFENNSGQPALITPPLEHGWHGRSDLIQSFEDGPPKMEDMSDSSPFNPNDDEDDDDDHVDDSDDEYDSDESQKSHETRKNSKWLKSFFELFDSLTVEQINEPEREWHCEACRGGPGAIEWYHGLQSLINHAKTKTSTRKLHRELAELLDEELRRRGTSVIQAGEAFGKWKGLNEKVVRDKEIVWPPMVIIRNTILDTGLDGKRRGMGGEELIQYFKSYNATRARHSYGPQGHRGMSALIFEASAMGFFEAKCLSKHFKDQGIGKKGWDSCCRMELLPDGKRQLYGYMADKRELDFFDQHSQYSPGKSKLKFKMRSYEEMVWSQMKQMNEDNQRLLWYKNKVVEEQKHSKAVEESLVVVTEKLRKISEESRIVRQRSKMHHEQNKEEMDYQEEFFKDQIKLMHKAQEEKEDNFEKIQQEELKKVNQYLENPSSSEDQQSRLEKAENFIKHQEVEMDEFAEERDKLQKEKEKKKAEMKKRYGQEEVALEEEYDAKLTRLMVKYTPEARTNQMKANKAPTCDGETNKESKKKKNRKRNERNRETKLRRDLLLKS